MRTELQNPSPLIYKSKESICSKKRWESEKWGLFSDREDDLDAEEGINLSVPLLYVVSSFKLH